MDRPTRRGSKTRLGPAYDRFRRRLVEARESVGLTQREAAVRLGRSQSFVAKSESGERRVDVVELQAFARAYGKRIEFFVPRE